MNSDRLSDKLDNAGHLHLFLDSGAEAKVSKHDTEVKNGRVIINSKEGHWEIPAAKVEYVDTEPSEMTPRAE